MDGRQVNIVDQDGKVIWQFANRGGRAIGLDKNSRKAMGQFSVPNAAGNGFADAADGEAWLDGLFATFRGPPGFHAEDTSATKAPGTLIAGEAP